MYFMRLNEGGKESAAMHITTQQLILLKSFLIIKVTFLHLTFISIVTH